MNRCIVLAAVQCVEIGNPVDAQENGLAVDHELTAAVLQRGFGDPGKAAGPIVTAAGNQVNALVVALDAQAVDKPSYLTS